MKQTCEDLPGNTLARPIPSTHASDLPSRNVTSSFSPFTQDPTGGQFREALKSEQADAKPCTDQSCTGPPWAHANCALIIVAVEPPPLVTKASRSKDPQLRLVARVLKADRIRGCRDAIA